ncbi:MAG: hypothetical protein QF903_03155 [Planctomycetota bacterium]|nr:hypothetical protein [Planctomycetota bacterium]MDP6763595.1 hypothetical protein [Planctomycetota bacterium]MDP6988456.1 hypothetical protein [Planctomycetota bacterium]
MTLAHAVLAALLQGAAAETFVHFETPHVSPLALSPGGATLCAVNTPDARLEVFDVSGESPRLTASVPVGLDPVSVRFRDETEVWVANHVSDSVSVVDLPSLDVVATLETADEPCDVVFAGTPERAFVSCSQAGRILVFDPADPTAAPVEIEIEGEDPRALARSLDGTTVYAAIFESGNGSTILSGGLDGSRPFSYPPDALGAAAGPHGGLNPPPNAGANFEPRPAADTPPPPRVGLIVKRDGNGRWRDDTGADWSDLVSGPDAPLSGRPVGWELLDHDLAAIDARDLSVTYSGGLMNLCMALAVHPRTGAVCVIGTDATNEVRFEPRLNGRFLRVNAAFVDAAGVTVVDLNPHLDYAGARVPQAVRDRSLGDPRGIAWSASSGKGYVSGMGSNNVVVIDAAGARAGRAATIEVGEGPTGLALDEARGRLFVLARFASALCVVDLATERETARIPFHDPTPQAVRAGRRLLYDTHATSGLGHVACGSCHVDGRMDRLAWDLGDPSGAVTPIAGRNLGANFPGFTGFEDYHPMKGPMTTQTLQGAVGLEPLHWRGDRLGIEDFAPAFRSLQGDDELPGEVDLAAFKVFLRSIHYPPNPFREPDNSLRERLALPGHFASGRFGPAGRPLPDGNARRGLALFDRGALNAGRLHCSTCHTLPTGAGTDSRWEGTRYAPIPSGPRGERNHALFAGDGSSQHHFKIPHLRNAYEKVGFETTRATARAGFGFLHDGSVDSLARFVSQPAFAVQDDQDVADVVAFLLSLTGSDLPVAREGDLRHPPGTDSPDAHAAIGRQTSVAGGGGDPRRRGRVEAAVERARKGAVGLVAKGRRNGERRGWFHAGGGRMQSDRDGETLGWERLFDSALEGERLTWTEVPLSQARRVGVDRDGDGALDRDELDAGCDPADPGSTPALLAHPAGCGPPVAAAVPRCTPVAGGGTTVILGVQGLPAGSLNLLVTHALGATPFGDQTRGAAVVGWRAACARGVVGMRVRSFARGIDTVLWRRSVEEGSTRFVRAGDLRLHRP